MGAAPAAHWPGWLSYITCMHSCITVIQDGSYESESVNRFFLIKKTVTVIECHNSFGFTDVMQASQ